MTALSSSQISSGDLDENTLYLTSDGYLLYNTTEPISGLIIIINNDPVTTVSTAGGELFDLYSSAVHYMNNVNGITYHDFAIDDLLTIPIGAGVPVSGSGHGIFVGPLDGFSSPLTNVSINIHEMYGIGLGEVLSFTVYVPSATTDTTAPVITLVGLSEIIVKLGTSYTDAGATATDNVDGDLTTSIVTVNPVNINTTGIYTITYNVSDAEGNAATEVTRTVRVMIFSTTNLSSGFLPKSSISLNGILSSKNASPFKTATVPQGSMFSLNRFQARKNVGLAPKYNDASMRTQMLRIKAQKPKSIANGVQQSYKNVKTTYRTARQRLRLVRNGR